MAAVWSSEPLNALECDPDRSSLELSVRDEPPRPESDRSTSTYDGVDACTVCAVDATAVPLALDEVDDVDDGDDNSRECWSLDDGGDSRDCWSFDGIAVGLTPTATAAGW